jgi:hypothetical protein
MERSMLDPVEALAFEMQSSKGVFALLLGSGISHSAKIPTGWHITLDLVRQVAALKGEVCGSDPAVWYRDRFSAEPSYSELLNQLATTPELRNQVIRGYIEPDEHERQRGEKMPTQAHRAIAELMAKGYVRVVLTTNFDQLLEQALRDHGVNPTVISSADHVAGARPLVHSGPVIIKLHGDYLDTRILNTEAELSEYAPAMVTLLDQVIDEFGLVICGWSGDWDVALKATIDRAPARRYPTYWAARGAPSTSAQKLIDRRAARLIPIDGADSFFENLGQRINAIETLKQPHPLSAEVAVAMLKDYLPEPRHQIRLHDLLRNEFNRLSERLESPDMLLTSGNGETFAELVGKYQAALNVLISLAFNAGMWSNEAQTAVWKDEIAVLAKRSNHGAGMPAFIDLKAYPATLLLYAFGLGTIVGRQPQRLGTLAGHVVKFDRFDSMALGDRLNINVLITDGGGDVFKKVKGYETNRLAGSNLVADLLKTVAKRELRDESSFDEAFARLELALAFGYGERQLGEQSHIWFPPGRYVSKRHLTDRIVLAWETDWKNNMTKSELAQMVGLAKAPRFADLRAFLNRVGFY